MISAHSGRVVAPPVRRGTGSSRWWMRWFRVSAGPCGAHSGQSISVPPNGCRVTTTMKIDLVVADFHGRMVP
jgi:hypothetical protein